MNKELSIVKTGVFDPCNLAISNIHIEKESKEYSACSFQMNGLKIHFRHAKITPTKTGQFVTFWKRINNGPIQPFDSSDPFDFLVVHVRKEALSGQFVFPKHELIARDIISKENKGGKRAIRVYPSWDITESNQANKTQKWQLKYFMEIQEGKAVDSMRVRRLYNE